LDCEINCVNSLDPQPTKPSSLRNPGKLWELLNDITEGNIMSIGRQVDVAYRSAYRNLYGSLILLTNAPNRKVAGTTNSVFNKRTSHFSFFESVYCLDLSS
jgi:hypothetical protein